MPILALQKRARELGRIRLGAKEPFTKRNGDPGIRPVKLDRFRLTSASKPLLEKVAELYGGEVKEWTPDGGAQQWEVLTDSTRLPIMVPPQPVTQWMETWGRGHCIHRCDGRINVLTDEPCDPEDPAHRDAKPTTRLNVVLRDVEGVGVWRIETHGWNAAIELPNAAEFLAQAGGYVNGWVSLEERVSVDTSGDKLQTRRFMVPIIEIDVTPAQLMAGQGRVGAPSVEGPVARQALTAGPTTPADAEPVLPTADDIEAATDSDVVRHIWSFLKGHDALTEELDQACQARVAELDAATPAPTADPAATAEAVWRQVIEVAGSLPTPMTLSEVTGDFEQRFALSPAEASASELNSYLEELRGAGVPA